MFLTDKQSELLAGILSQTFPKQFNALEMIAVMKIIPIIAEISIFVAMIFLFYLKYWKNNYN